jgi:hypothetical protein
MCTYSLVMGEWWHPTWPASPSPAPALSSPNAIPWLTIVSDPNLAQQMLDILAKLDALDKRLDKLDCKVEKVSKKKIETKLKRIAKGKRSR